VAVWAADNPFKSHQTPLKHRMAMLQILIDTIDPPERNIRLYPELSSPRTLYTLETAKRIWMETTFTLVIGSDLIYQLPSWYQIETVLQQVNLLVVPRPGYPLREVALRELRRMGARIAIADLTGLNISSTAYRENRETDGITPPVQAYIHREHLYECQDISREKQPI
jgi:nicotinate-nucleotide adenylyltransferase